MVARDRPLRGLTSLRTLGGRSAQALPAYQAYLRVSFLQLERARHGQEIRTARQRLDFMIERCRQIDADTAEILVGVGASINTPRPPGTPGGRLPSPQRRRGFRIAY